MLTRLLSPVRQRGVQPVRCTGVDQALPAESPEAVAFRAVKARVIRIAWPVGSAAASLSSCISSFHGVKAQNKPPEPTYRVAFREQ